MLHRKNHKISNLKNSKILPTIVPFFMKRTMVGGFCYIVQKYVKLGTLFYPLMSFANSIKRVKFSKFYKLEMES